MRLPVIAILILAGAGVVTTPAIAGDERNAATWYIRAIQRYDVIVASKPVVVRRAALGRLRAALARPDMPPPPEVRRFLAEMQPVLRLVRQGARRRHHDFELPYDEGADIVLPHLSYMRTFGQILGAETLERLHHGDTTTAAEDLAGLYRMAEQAGRDELLLSSVVGTETFDLAERLTQSAIDRGQLGPFESATVLRPLRDIDAENPFRLTEGVASERMLMMPSFQERYSGDGGLVRLRDELDWLLDDPVNRARFAVMRQSDLDAALDAAEIVSDQVLEVLQIKDEERALVELQRLDRAILRGEHGEFARLVFADFASIYRHMQRARRALLERIALLDGIASGRIDPMDAANAAVWYRRAIARWQRLDPAARAAVRTLADNPAQPVEAPLRQTLDAAQPIIDELRAASAMPRCVFIAPDAQPIAIAAHHAPLRSLIALLHADAVRWIQAQDFDRVVDRFAIAFRVVGHVGKDTTIVGSTLAHVGYEATQTLLDPGLRASRFTIEHRQSLLRAAREAGYPDVFGYTASAEMQLASVRRWVRAHASRRDLTVDAALDAAIEPCRVEQILFLAICANELGGGRASVPATEDATLAPLDDVISLTALAHAREQAGVVAELIGDERFDVLCEPLAPAVVPVTRRRVEAPALLRRSLVTLRGEEPVPPPGRKVTRPGR